MSFQLSTLRLRSSSFLSLSLARSLGRSLALSRSRSSLLSIRFRPTFAHLRLRLVPVILMHARVHIRALTHGSAVSTRECTRLRVVFLRSSVSPLSPPRNAPRSSWPDLIPGPPSPSPSLSSPSCVSPSNNFRITNTVLRVFDVSPGILHTFVGS